MEDILYSILLGVVQGLTEFLPISSTAHLIILSQWLGLDSEQFGLLFNVVLHGGTLIAVCIYFRHSLYRLWRAWLQTIRTQKINTTEERWSWYVLAGTIIVGGLAAYFKDTVELIWYDTKHIAWLLILFSVWYGLVDLWYRQQKDLRNLRGWKIGLTQACAQLFALFPGVSRSGVTYTTGLLLRVKAEQAAEYTFLLSVPLIGGITVAALLEVSQVGSFAWTPIVVGMISSAITGWLAIDIFMNLIKKTYGLWIFWVYRVLLGVLLLML